MKVRLRRDNNGSAGAQILDNFSKSRRRRDFEKFCKKTPGNDVEMTPPVSFLGEVLTRPSEVLEKVILELLRFWAPMRLALDTHGGGVPKTDNKGSAGATILDNCSKSRRRRDFEKKCEKTSENEAEIAKVWGSSY